MPVSRQRYPNIRCTMYADAHVGEIWIEHLAADVKVFLKRCDRADYI